MAKKRRQQQKVACSIFSQAKNITNTNFWVFGAAQVKKLIWFKFPETFPVYWDALSRLVQEVWVYAVIWQKLGKYTFFKNQQCHFKDFSCLFIISDYLTMIWSQCVNIRADLDCSALITKCFRAKKISIEQCWFRADSLWHNAVERWSALNFSIVNSAASENIRADQLWNSAEQRWCFSCFLNQHWTVLKNLKSLKQRCSALKIFGTSTR